MKLSKFSEKLAKCDNESLLSHKIEIISKNEKRFSASRSLN